jgi:hypothetical protein
LARSKPEQSEHEMAVAGATMAITCNPAQNR